MSPANIWVVDDDDDHREGLCDLIAAAGHRPIPLSSGLAARDALTGALPDLILSDLRMPGLDGIGVLEAVRSVAADLPLILLTGHGDVTQAVRAMQRGAQDFLEKPYDADHLLTVVERSLAAGRLHAEVRMLRERLKVEGAELVGETTAIAAVRARLTEIARLPVDVILQGETGTGKELAARSLHTQSGRSGPFVTINCAALPNSGIDVDLFGRIDGAGTLQPGRIGLAEGGTLFLDQIDVMPLELQPLLLRLLQSRQIEPVGGREPIEVDLRVVASTSKDLRELIAQGAFRQDLYYRLAGVEIHMPPLRQIAPDIPILFVHFLTQAAARHGVPVPEIAFAERKALQSHDWPGNAHQLRQAAHRRILGLDGVTDTRDLAVTGTLKDRVARFEALEIMRVLDQCRGNTARAAAQLGIPRRTLNAKMNRQGIKP
ncbi:sigma-54-dependent transcriptional regulator [Pseudosulfitobacter pseudonitzschiae]|uniref:sigma-54-dependent transcriptional regulator n=1 Tax=Pseudosulfitobacter pseudonitzschiae TaxID=1402135 RepID=UPI001AFC3CD9|nr:sigma-54 dependent transcriptional regulator [Pseudosulfitobacter pseudonitzschiae]MBM1817973.1 sigma-54-dependent Fis family transcriptional regulator [Pseudosulfitobacter pseudonitzschiae]MBM1835031.1 sigma-54-dependent Fis family transcriptional regulator [Pseudosulfitobacter pseudonitzschiae]MBM1839832.1 sigma-54-dependent Fis family transcriptional regulator [Pseudosulfitobacter pseudonitzschiae]MBM1844752.1 sigma-54-dependent Fis family transcriptional regulator [Pseudosulfitobacter ps